MNSFSELEVAKLETRNIMSDKTGRALVEANALIDRAAKHDGQKAISDQTLIEASQSTENKPKREFFGFYSAKQSQPLAIGIVGASELDLVVEPELRGNGIGAFAFDALLNKAGSGDLRVWVHGLHPAADKLLEKTGFKRVRTLLRLTCPPARAKTAKPEIPDDFSMQTFERDNKQQLKDLVEVNAAAFADHPEQGALTLTDIEQIMNETWFDQDDLLLCYHQKTARLAGFGWIKTTPYDVAGNKQLEHEESESARLETELYVIGVHPDFAGRGLGSALLEEVFARMAVHNPARITLYVEGDNTPALTVYKRAGFTVDTESHQWLRNA